MEQEKKDKRRHLREAQLETITFSVIGSFSGKKEFLPSENHKATVVDMSENGIGIFTRISLEPGMLVKFNEIKGTNVGIVMWAIDLGDRYRCGLKFV